MRATFYDENQEPIGTAWLDEQGVARFSAGLAKIGRTNILVAGDRWLEPSDGEEFMRALPGQYRSYYLHAELDEGEEAEEDEAAEKVQEAEEAPPPKPATRAKTPRKAREFQHARYGKVG